MSTKESVELARAALHEQERVAHRMAQRRKDRDMIEARLAAARTACAYEQEDVDRLTKGVGGVLRGFFARREDLTREMKELEAGKLLCAELEEELAAIDMDLAQLSERAAKVTGAKARWEAILAELADQARARGEKVEELDALAAADVRLRLAQVDIDEAINHGVTAQRHVEECTRRISNLLPSTLGDPFIDLVQAATTNDMVARESLKRTIAAAQQAVRAFHHACADLVGLSSHGLAIDLPELGSIVRFVGIDVFGTQALVMEEQLAELSRLSSAIVSCVGELRARRERHDAEQAGIAKKRQELLT